MTSHIASTGLDTESARAFVNDVTDAYIDGGGGTHWDGCHTEHPRCAALMGARNMTLLLNDVERLAASYGWLDERFPALKAEVERLREENAALRNIAGLTAASLTQLEFAEHEATDEALTHRLIVALTRAAGGEEAVAALLGDRTDTT